MVGFSVCICFRVAGFSGFRALWTQGFVEVLFCMALGWLRLKG